MFRRCQFAILFLSVLALGACVPPLPLTHRTEAPNGSKVPDLDFVRAGVTTRDEVVQRLKNIDTGATHGMFWGLYNHSVMSDPGGSRYWDRTNLLITFDEHGVVKTSRRASENQLNHVLLEWLASRPKQLFDADSFHPEKTIPASTNLHRLYSNRDLTPASLVLRSDNFSIVESGQHGKPAFSIDPAKIKRIRSTSPELCCDPNARSNGKVVELIWIDIRETGKAPVSVELSPANILVLLDYLRQFSPNIKWQ